MEKHPANTEFQQKCSNTGDPICPTDCTFRLSETWKTESTSIHARIQISLQWHTSEQRQNQKYTCERTAFFRRQRTNCTLSREDLDVCWSVCQCIIKGWPQYYSNTRSHRSRATKDNVKGQRVIRAPSRKTLELPQCIHNSKRENLPSDHTVHLTVRSRDMNGV